MNNRLVYLDMLRSAAVLLGTLAVILHSWTAFYNWCSFIILPVLVCISAYFSAAVLRIHTFRSFFSAKWLRIGIPWLIAAVVFAPEESFITYLQQGGTDGFLSFYLQNLGSSSYAVGTHWFLGFLLLMCIVLMGIKKGYRQLLQHRVHSQPGPVFFFLFVILSTLLLYGASCLSSLHIAGVHILPPRADWLCLGILYAALGVYAFRCRWFTANGYIPPIGCFFAFLVVNATYGIVSMSPFTAVPFLLPLLQTLLSLTAVLGLTAAFHSWNRIQADTARAASRFSYPFYFISEPIILNAFYFLQPLAIAYWLKALLVLLLTSIYGGLLCKYALLHVPCFKRII